MVYHILAVVYILSNCVSTDILWSNRACTHFSAGNIGLSRDFDSRWTTQYNSLFCVLNHLGQVVTWRLTPQLQFLKVENVLIALKQRLDSQGKCLKEFYIDNCCSWRKKLQSVFGPNLVVYLDLFHALKRLCDKIPKRHSLRAQCIQDYRMVFREPTDHGPTRTKTTPAPSVIMAALDKFESKWAPVEYHGEKVLSTAALCEIRNIRNHIEKGCLSGIKPGRGTNRNEALHKELNRIMSSSRYGVELAFALLCTTFFRHNEHLQAKADGRNERPIEHYATYYEHHSNTGEMFGLTFKPPSSAAANYNPSLESWTRPLDFRTDSYSDFLQRINCIEEHPIQINTLRRDCGDNDSDDDSDEDGDGNDDAPSYSLALEVPSQIEQDRDNDDLMLLPLSEALQMLLKAVLWMCILEQLSDCTETAKVNHYTLPFMQMTLSMFAFNESEERHNGNDYDAHEERLQNVLTSWNFKRLPVSGDGNCLFYAAALVIKTKAQGGNKHMQDIIQCLDCEQQISVTELAHILRQSVVNEWQGENKHTYQSFLTQTQIEKEAERFSRSGQFSGEVGDLVLTAMCNVLKTPIVVFSSISDVPVIVITPTTGTATTSETIHLAYSQYGPGHYDAVSWHTEETIEENRQRIKCTCGRNKSKTSNRAACTLVLEHYATKCPCFKANIPCTEICKCKQCQNPNGRRPLKQKIKLQTGQKRSREVFETQLYKLEGKKTATFMKEVGEEIDIGVISTFEFLLVSVIIQHLYPDVDWTNIDKIDSKLIHDSFNMIKGITQQLNINAPIFSRSKQDIEKALKKYKFQYEYYFKMHHV